jgi:hypothetical protein
MMDDPLSRFFSGAGMPKVTTAGGAFGQPTGATSTGDGNKSSQPQSIELQRIEQHDNPPHTPIADTPTNSWTSPLTPSIHRGKIDAWTGPQHMPGPTHEQGAHIAAELMRLAMLDNFLARVREKLTPRYWERRGGVATATGGAAAGAGLGQGTAGAATIQPARCLLDMVHNPSATTPATVALGELDGDPVPKVQLTIAPGGFAPLPAAGLLFNHGIVLLSSTMPLTFAGRTLD